MQSVLSLGRFNPDLSSATPRILFLRKIFRALRVLLFYTPRRLENRRLVFRGRTSNPSIHPSSFHPYQSRDFHIFLMVTPATCHIDHPQRIIINSKSSGRRKRVYFPRSILFSFQTFLPVGSMRKDGPSVLLPRRRPPATPSQCNTKGRGVGNSPGVVLNPLSLMQQESNTGCLNLRPSRRIVAPIVDGTSPLSRACIRTTGSYRLHDVGRGGGERTERGKLE